MSGAFRVGEVATLGLMGAVLGGLYVVAVSRWAPSATRTFAVGLVVAAVIYPLFAVFAGASGAWIGAELVGVLVFGGLALPALVTGRTRRTAAALVAVGWGLHPLWDVLLHIGAVGGFPDAPGVAHVPSWYPPACATFDWVVALAAAVVTYRRPTVPAAP